MKRSYDVRLDSLKHDTEAKTGDHITTLNLELPGDVDLRFLQRVFQRFLEPMRGESGHFRLFIEDEDGTRRTFELISKGTKTKNFKLVAVVQLDFNAAHGFERYFGQLYFEGAPRPVLTFEAELLQPNALLETVDKMHQDLGREGMELTITSGGKSATIGKRKEREHDA